MILFVEKVDLDRLEPSNIVCREMGTDRLDIMS